jgi:RES domain-containing protein
MAAVYGSFTPETAMAETLAYSRYFGLPPQAAMPRTFVAVSVRLACVFDLTIGEHRRLLRVSERRMLETDWREELRQGKTPLTHEVAQAAFNAGFEGLIVPSAAAPRGRNLVVFVGNLREESRLAWSSGEAPLKA